jgi:hypothetical protein
MVRLAVGARDVQSRESVQFSCKPAEFDSQRGEIIRDSERDHLAVPATQDGIIAGDRRMVAAVRPAPEAIGASGSSGEVDEIHGRILSSTAQRLKVAVGRDGLVVNEQRVLARRDV